MPSRTALRRPALRASHAGPLVLVATNDERVRRGVCAALDHGGMRALVADAGLPIDELADQLRPVAIVLDLDSDRPAAHDLLGRLRRRSVAPVIALSARATEDDKVEALDAGADDYVTKPFGTNELIARIRVARRRGETAVPLSTALELGALRVDPARHLVSVDGRSVPVTPIELHVLVALARRRGAVVTREQLLREVWGTSETDAPLRVHIAKLRKKLGDAAARPRWLFTVVGVGYRLVSS